MADWQTIIDAPSLQAAQSATPTVADIPAGSPVRVLIDFNYPGWLNIVEPIPIIGWGVTALENAPRLADLAGSEWWVPKLAGISSEFQVDDVHVNGDNQIEIDGTPLGIAPLVLVAAIAGALAVLSVAAYFFGRTIVQAQIAKEITKQEITGEQFLLEAIGAGVPAQDAYNYLMGITSGAQQSAQTAASAGGVSGLTGFLGGISLTTIAIIGIGAFLLLRRK